MAFFDKVGETLTNTTIQVANKAKDLAELGNINVQISKQEDYIQKAYVTLGKAYLEKNISNTEDEYAIQMKAILEGEQKIKDMKEQIHQLKGIVICEKCGGEVPKQNTFCPHCGTRTAKEEKKEDSNAGSVIRVCPNCDSEVSAVATFCPTCGQKFD